MYVYIYIYIYIIVAVFQSHKLTCLALWSSVTRDASTCVRIDSVSTNCSIYAWVAKTFVNIYKNNVTFSKI